MEGPFKRFKITNNKSLRYKLILAFSLMSIIPLLACTYLISIYVFPSAKTIIDISAIVLSAVIIALLGFIFARGLINPVIDMALEARIIANGEYGRRITVESDDEVGNIASSINFMTQKIRTNLEELKSYGQKMKEINVDVHKKVLALSNLLQLGDIISGGSIKIDSLLELAVEKAAMVFDSGFGVLYMSKEDSGDFFTRASYNADNENLESIIVKHDGKGFLNKVLAGRSPVIIDRDAKRAKDIDDFLASNNLKNILLLPLSSGRRDFGLLVIGVRQDDFKFKSEDVDLIKVFAKQITIAIESDILTKKTEELAIKDELTDLYNKNYIVTRLEDEIKRAIFYQRPCSFIIFNIDNFEKFRELHGEIASEELIKKVAKVIKENATPVGKVARIGGDEFGMLLPEKNKREAMLIAEEVRKRVASSELLKEVKETITISGGVGENPIDGATNEEIYKKAMDNLREAKSAGRNKMLA